MADGSAAEAFVAFERVQKSYDGETLVVKDLNLAIEACQKLNLVLPQATAAWETYNATIAGGDGDNDAISVLKTLERLAGHEIGELT